MCGSGETFSLFLVTQETISLWLVYARTLDVLFLLTKESSNLMLPLDSELESKLRKSKSSSACKVQFLFSDMSITITLLIYLSRRALLN